MILALDVGNSNIYGGVFEGDQLRLQFRKNSKYRGTSDEIGLFLKSALRENDIDPGTIRHIAICSVVPDLDHTLRNCCRKYFDMNPFFLQSGVKTGLKIRYHNPHEVGADRIANSIAAVHLYPGKDIVIADFGTATTFCAVSSEKDYLGGAIMAGMGISAEALESRTAKLPSVEIIKPTRVVGRSTVESIQSGLFYSNVGAVRTLVEEISKECFGGNRPIVIGTGGFASLFADCKLFDVEISDLVLKGLLLSHKLNV